MSTPQPPAEPRICRTPDEVRAAARERFDAEDAGRVPPAIAEKVGAALAAADKRQRAQGAA